MNFDWTDSIFLGDEMDLSRGGVGPKDIEHLCEARETVLNLLFCTHEGSVVEESESGWGGKRKKRCTRCHKVVG